MTKKIFNYLIGTIIYFTASGRDVDVHVKNETPIKLEVRYVIWSQIPIKKPHGNEAIHGIAYLDSGKSIDPINIPGGANAIHFRIFPQSAGDQQKYVEYIRDFEDFALKNINDSGKVRLTIKEESFLEQKEQKEEKEEKEKKGKAEEENPIKQPKKRIVKDKKITATESYF